MPNELTVIDVPRKSKGGVMVTAAPHPFRVERAVAVMPEGMTVLEMVQHAQPDPVLARHAVVHIGGHVIHRDKWHLVRPKSGTHLEIRVIPQGGGGGGKNPFRMILQLAVMVLSFVLAPYLAPYLTGIAGALGISANTLATSLIGAVGMLLVNVIAPVKPPSLKNDKGESPTPTIEGARNVSRPFYPVPSVLGRHRVAPPYGSSPYTEVIGGKHYLRMILVWGIGPLQIDESSLKIGETPLSQFTGVEIEHRQGYDTDQPLSLYSNTVYQENLTVTLKQVDGYAIRNTTPIADEISFDITFPIGLVKYKDDGGKKAISVAIEVDYRKVGDVTWLTPSYNGQTTENSTVSGKTITFTYKKITTVREGFRFAVAERAEYEVRMRRMTDDHENDQKYADQSVWSALRTITNEDPIQSAVPIAKTALRILASDQLNNVIDTFTGVVTTLGKDFNGSTWVDDQPITNPAALFRHVLQGNAIAEPLADSRLDLTQLEYFYNFCDTKGFTFNQNRDFVSSVYDTLRDVSGAGRAAPILIDGKWSVVIEEPQAAPVSHITPRNSYNFSAEKFFPDVPHAWRIRFSNDEQDWRSDEYRVYRDGYSRSNATKFETLEIPGVTTPAQLYKLGRFRIAQGVLMPERWTFSQDMEFLTYRRGDRVLITHDILVVGLAYGRIKAVVADTSLNIISVTLDNKVPMSGTSSYGLSVRNLNNPAVTAQVVTVAGEYDTLTFTTPVPPIGGVEAIAAGDIFGFGILGQETDDASILAVIPENEIRARVTAVPYREAIFNVDTEEIPAFETNITDAITIPSPVIRNIISDETVLERGPGTSLITRMLIEFDPVDDPRLANPTIEVQGKPTETDEPYSGMTIEFQDLFKVMITNLNDGEQLDLRIRFRIDGLLLPGPWTYSYNNLVIGKSTPPMEPQNLTISAIGGNAYLRWDPPTELDVQLGGKIQFRHSPSLTGASWTASASIGTAANANTLFAVLPLKEGTYLARTFDSGGTPSDAVASVTSKQATVLAFANIDTIDEAPLFLGTHTNTVASGGSLILSGIGLWDDIPDFDAEGSIDYYGGVATSGTYDFAAGFDLTTVQKVRLTTRLALTSYDIYDSIDGRLDTIDTWQDIDGTSQANGDCIIWVRHTDDDPASTSPAWSAWERLDSAEFEARGFDFKAVLSTGSSSYNVQVSELGVDVEDIV